MAEPVQDLLEHLGSLRRYGRILTNDRDLADELVQECCLAVLRRRPDWSAVVNPRAYLLSMLRNLWIDRLRHARREPEFVPLDEVAWMLAGPAVQEARSDLLDLIACMDMLPHNQKIAVERVAVRGEAYGDVARDLGLPVGTVMSRLSRGRESLRDAMSREPVA